VISKRSKTLRQDIWAVAAKPPSRCFARPATSHTCHPRLQGVRGEGVGGAIKYVFRSPDPCCRHLLPVSQPPVARGLAVVEQGVT